MKITFRRMNFECPKEVRYISEMDTLIPLMFDPDIERPEQMVLDRVDSFTKMLQDDVAVTSENQVVGFHIIKKGIFFGRPVGNISTLWVDPDFRRQGIARILKRRAENWARSEKLHCLYTSTFSVNEPMLNLNEEMGFKIISHRLQRKL